MSSIASYTVVPIAQLDTLREAAVSGKTKDTFNEALGSVGTSRSILAANGFYCVMALIWLEEHAQVDLMNSSHDDLASFLSKSRQASCFILTQDQLILQDYITPGTYSPSELTQFYKDFNEQDDANSGQGMIDSMVWLKACLGQVDEDHLGILMVR